MVGACTRRQRGGIVLQKSPSEVQTCKAHFKVGGCVSIYSTYGFLMCVMGTAPRLAHLLRGSEC